MSTTQEDDPRRVRTGEEIQRNAERHAMRLGLTMEKYGEYARSLIVKRHVDLEKGGLDLLRCPECGDLWPCDNELTFLRGVARGRELAAEHGW